MMHASTLLTIVLMATVTYLTRALGYLVLRNRSLSERAVTVMEAAPGCVLISVIAPYFVSERPTDLVALAATLLAATHLSMLPTVIIGVAVSGLLQHITG
ncbi:MAG: AzlD family protein [Herbaspirillum sp.]